MQPSSLLQSHWSKQSKRWGKCRRERDKKGKEERERSAERKKRTFFESGEKKEMERVY
jgi:hypothetical protein